MLWTPKRENADRQYVKGKGNVLFISHRVQSLLNFHRIYFMEGGQIIDVGNYHELSLRNRRFEQLIIS